MDSRLIPLAYTIKVRVGQNAHRAGDPIVIQAPLVAKTEVLAFCAEVHSALVTGTVYWAHEQLEFLAMLAERQDVRVGHSVILVGAENMPPQAVTRLTAGDYVRPSLLILVTFCPLAQLCGSQWPSNFHERMLGSFSWPLHPSP